MKSVVITILLLLTPHLCGAKVVLPDSMLTVRNVYYYSITHPDTSLAIIATMRERQMAPEWRLDLMEGDVNYSMRRFLKALACYEKVDGNKTIDDSTNVQLFLLKWQMDCFDALLVDEGLASAILRLRKKAQECGNKVFEAVSFFMSGKWHHYHRQQTHGYRYCLDAVETVKASDDAGKHVLLGGFYGELVKMYANDGNYDEALRFSFLQESEAHQPWPIPVLGAAERALRQTYAIRASMLAKAGRMTDAEKAYTQWKQTTGGNAIDDEEIYDYLRLSHHDTEALNVIMDYREFIRVQGDSISMRMLSVLNKETLLHLEMEDYENAALHGREIGRIVDSLFLLKSADQMQTSYELFHEQTVSDRKTLWLSLMTVILVALLLLALVILYYMRMIRRRNKMLLRVLNGLDAYRQAVISGGIPTSPDAIAALDAIRSYRPEETNLTPKESEEPDDDDRRLYIEMDSKVTRDRLFLKQGLSREDLMRLIGVDKNRFGKMMSKYSDASNTSVYINTKRVEYGAKLLIEQPEYTIATIATECGMSNTVTFNRTFKDVYNMTPSEYRQKMNEVLQAQKRA